MTSDDNTTTVDIRNRAGAATRDVAQTVRCPHCKAGPGMQCQRQLRRGGPAPFPHPSRLDAALALISQEGS